MATRPCSASGPGAGHDGDDAVATECGALKGNVHPRLLSLLERSPLFEQLRQPPSPPAHRLVRLQSTPLRLQLQLKHQLRLPLLLASTLLRASSTIIISLWSGSAPAAAPAPAPAQNSSTSFWTHWRSRSSTSSGSCYAVPYRFGSSCCSYSSCRSSPSPFGAYPGFQLQASPS